MAEPVGQAYRSLAARLRLATTAALEGSWRQLPNLGDEMVAAWAARGAIQLDTAQAQIGSATSAYLTSTAPAGRRAPAVVPADVLTSLALRGVPAEELLMRAPEQAWFALSEGASPEEATDRGALRVVQLVAAGLQLAHTHSARHVMKARKVRQYRRDARANACDLCGAAAQQTYATDDLMPIHTGCACLVVPVWGRADEPGEESMEDERLEDDVAVRVHGELGPILTDADYVFTGPH